RDRAGKICVEHTGGLPGMLSRTILVPEIHLGIVVLTNTDPGGFAFRSISQTIMDAYLGVRGPDWIKDAQDQIEEMQTGADSVTQEGWKTVEAHASNEIEPQNLERLYREPCCGHVGLED